MNFSTTQSCEVGDQIWKNVEVWGHFADWSGNRAKRPLNKTGEEKRPTLSQNLAELLSDQYLAKADHAANKESLE